ncbi:SGNH/GDSL hydrolase family protein [Sphingomonas sp. RS2018]
MLGLKLHAASPVLMRVTGQTGAPPTPPPPPPSWSVPPVITGTPSVGATLTVGDGTIANGAVKARAWRRDGVAIAGASAATYVVVSADQDAMIDVVVTAGGPGGVAPATAAAVGPVGVAAPVAIERIVIEGDSITSTTPNQADNHVDFYGYVWNAAHATLTVSVAGQASRTVGGAGDPGSPTGNTLLDARAADMATGAQLLTVMIGANDLGTFTAEDTLAKLEAWAAPIRAAGIRIAISPPTPYRDAAPRHPNYAIYTERRAAYIAALRDPVGWGRFADAYIPMGEHPDFADPTRYSDTVHPNGPVSAGGTGKALLYAVFAAAMRSLIDPARRTATAPYSDVWPQDETNLAAGSSVLRRLTLSGLGDAGVASGVAVTGGGAQARLNGGAWATTLGHVYNGDTVDVRVTAATGAGDLTSYDLRIGSETRHITLRTVASVTPASYAHGGIANVQPAAADHLFPALAFAGAGTAVLAVKGSGNPPNSVTIGGVAATRRFTLSTDGYLDLWTTELSAAGIHDVEVRHEGYRAQTTLSWGVVRDADAVPTQIDASAPLHQSAPHATGALVVPARGIAVAVFGEYGGASVAPASVRSGTTFIDEARGIFQGEAQGICLGTRTDSGAATFDFAFGSHPRGAIIFKAAGS